MAKEIEQREFGRGFLRAERPARRQLQRDSGKVFRHFRKAIPPDAEGRVVNGEPGPADLAQDHEMVHVPVQNRGGSQVAQVSDLQPQRTSRKTELGRDVHYRPECRALQ